MEGVGASRVVVRAGSVIGWSGRHVHELRVREGVPVRRGWSGHHVHELRVRDGAPVRPAWHEPRVPVRASS